MASYAYSGVELWRIEEMSVEDFIDQYQDNERIEYIEPDYELKVIGVPNDPNFSSLWAMNNTGQTGGLDDADIDAVEA